MTNPKTIELLNSTICDSGKEAEFIKDGDKERMRYFTTLTLPDNAANHLMSIAKKASEVRHSLVTMLFRDKDYIQMIAAGDYPYHEYFKPDETFYERDTKDIYELYLLLHTLEECE